MIRIANNNDLLTLSRYARIVASELHASGVNQWSETYPDYPDFEKDLLRDALFVVELEGQVVGSISVLPENDPYYRLLAWKGYKALVVHRLMVLPEYRRHKLGTTLFNFAIDKAKNEGYDSIKVDTHPDNIRMQNLIVSVGFKEVGYMPGFNRIGYEIKF